ncbi:unnamed protein product [Closterium sp. NIES-65]|nr:unnamed protein product [Closterium sp. NIES-65]
MLTGNKKTEQATHMLGRYCVLTGSKGQHTPLRVAREESPAAGYHCERDEAETPSDQEDDVANAVIRDAEEWSDDSDEWWVAGRYDGEEVDVWVAGQDE